VENRLNADETRQTLCSKRVCAIDNGLYMIFDYYQDIDGQPMTCIIQVDAFENEVKESAVKLPDYLNIYKEITDQEEYQAHTLANKKFEMSQEDKLATSGESSSKIDLSGLIDTSQSN
jgi:hypothetical protein